jgi:hypothetical protein
MIKKLIIILILFINSPVLAAEAKVEQTFHVKTTPEKIEKWVLCHQNELAVARGFRILTIDNKSMRVKVISPLKEQEIILERVIRHTDIDIIIGSRLEQVISGDIISYSDQIRLVGDGTGTTITITSIVKISNNNFIFEWLSNSILESYVSNKVDNAKELLKNIGKEKEFVTSPLTDRAVSSIIGCQAEIPPWREK